MASYRLLVVGVGKRGMHHARAFQANGRFEVVGVCDVDQARLDAAANHDGAVPLCRERWTSGPAADRIR